MTTPVIGEEYVLDVDYVTEMGDKVEAYGCQNVSESHRFELMTRFGDSDPFDYSLMSTEKRGSEAPMLKLTSDVFGDVLREP